MKRKLFCELSPVTLKISIIKCRMIRVIKDFFGKDKFALSKSDELLSITIYKHNSLIRRKLGNVNMVLQENKAVNLSLAAPKVSNILIHPGETFSFWKLVGNLSVNKGYKEGLTISKGAPNSGIGGGMCQFTNLIHWMVLHTSMGIIEHHHHDGLDLFPDYNRQIPFGTGTSILYNYLDYRFKNNTDIIYQLITYTTDEYLCGEIRANKRQAVNYHVKSENEHFIEENDVIFRQGQVYRECIDIKTGNCIKRELICNNHAKVMYDTKNLFIINNSVK